MKIKNLHKWQALSLLVAIALLWVPGNHKYMMIGSSVIVGVNAIIEFTG